MMKLCLHEWKRATILDTLLLSDEWSVMHIKHDDMKLLNVMSPPCKGRSSFTSNTIALGRGQGCSTNKHSLHSSLLWSLEFFFLLMIWSEIQEELQRVWCLRGGVHEILEHREGLEKALGEELNVAMANDVDNVHEEWVAIEHAQRHPSQKPCSTEWDRED